MSNIPFPASLKKELRDIAQARKYPLVERILARGHDEEVIVDTQEEAQALVNVARVEMLSAELMFPFWNEDSPDYDMQHEDAFQDVQMGIFEKTTMYVGQSFVVNTRP
jgi:hypothetical protein